MKHVIDSSIYAALQFRLYRYRFLLTYIVIGFASIWLELLLMRGLNHIGLAFWPARLLGLAAGVLFAFWMNVRFNFKVPVSKRNRALVLFIAISAGSVLINFLFKNQLITAGWSYEQARLATSAVLFSFGYLLHRRFSFSDRKQVGVAVYANGVEDIRTIRDKISDFPDFIHVDLIDASFGDADTDVRAYRLEAIRAYWPKRPVQVHLMTRHPLKWLPDVLPYADTVIVHQEIDDALPEVLTQIRAAGRHCGLALLLSTDLAAAKHSLDSISVLMLLTIAQPGRSGQSFQHASALEKIREINTWPERKNFSLCVDGGVNETNIHLLNVELVVSGSSVLRADDPCRQIMRLQTCNNHEAV